MAKLSKKQTAELTGILKSIEWANEFLMSEETIVARTCHPNDVLAYLPANKTAFDSGFYPAPAIHNITKDIGSPLCGFNTAMSNLRKFINSEK